MEGDDGIVLLVLSPDSALQITISSDGHLWRVEVRVEERVEVRMSEVRMVRE